MRIKKLTSKQLARISEIREEWRQVSMSPGPANLSALRPVIDKLYHAVELPPPRIFRFSSPLTCMMLIPRIAAFCGRKRRLSEDDISRKINNSLGDISKIFSDGVARRIFDSLGDFDYGDMSLLRHDINPSVNIKINRESPIPLSGRFNYKLILVGGIDDRFNSQLITRIQQDARLDETVALEIERELDASSIKNIYVSQMGQYFSGCSEVSWLTFCQFQHEVGVKHTDDKLERMRWWEDIVKNCFWWWPKRQFVVFCDRPVSKWDDQNRPHCEDGPAISFDDGYRIYFWHGVRVPEEVIIAPEKQTLSDIDQELHVEIRRIRIERFGWQRYLQKTRATTLDKRKNEVEGTNEVLMQCPNENVLVCACPSTGRVYALQVPQEINSCEQAQNWLSGGLSGRITAAT